MKSTKNTNFLFLVFVLLLASTALVWFLGRDRYAPVESAQASEALFADLEKDSVARLVIDGPEDQHVELAREGEDWKVASEGNYRADKTKVEQAVAEIVELKQGRVVSSNPDALPDFNLEGDEAIQVSALDGEGRTLASVIIGKGENDYSSSYVKLPDQAEVRKLSEGIRSSFEATQGWRDRTILKEGAESDVMRLEITGPDGPVVLAREEVRGPKEGEEGDAAAEAAEEEGSETAAAADGEPDETPEEEVKEVVWNEVEPLEGRATKWICDSMARSMTALDCDSFYTGDKTAAELGLDPPRYVVTAFFKEEGKSTVLHLGDKDDTKYPVKLPDSDTIWWIPSFRGDYFTKKPREYLENPPPEEEEAAEEPPAEGEPPAAGEAAQEATAAPDDGGAPATLEELATGGGAKPSPTEAQPAGSETDDGEKQEKPEPDPDGDSR